MRMVIDVHDNLYFVKYSDFEYWPNIREDKYNYEVMEQCSEERLYELMAILTLTGDYQDVRRLINVAESKGL